MLVMTAIEGAIVVARTTRDMRTARRSSTANCAPSWRPETRKATQR